MIKSLFTLVLVALGNLLCSAQSVQDIINEVNTANLELSVAELSGEQATTINGVPQTITSRVQSVNDLAASYIEERLLNLPNLNVEVQEFNTVGKNIIATQLGQTNPESIYLVCAHYDSVTTFCADDNATGVAAVLELARILSTQCLDNTIVYALWDEEEIGLRGANFYAQQAASTSGTNTRANISAVINMDMIGYDGDAPGTPGDNDFDIDVRNIANSIGIKDDLLNLLGTYTFNLNPIVVNPGTTASDHSRFWAQNYSAVLVGESWETNDQTPDYHTSNDRIDDIDFSYMTEITKLVVAYFATKGGLAPLDNTVTSTSDALVANDTSASYQWFDCDTDSDVPGATSRSFTPLSSGNYGVEVSNGLCSEISACFNFSVLESQEFTDDEIRVFPNPAESELRISNVSQFDLQIAIVTLSGKTLLKQASKKTSLVIDIQNLATGVYFVQLSSGDKASTYKFVKE